MLAKLGKHSTGKGCLYIKKLADVDHGRARGTLIAEALVSTDPAEPDRSRSARFALEHIVARDRQRVTVLGELELVIDHPAIAERAAAPAR